MSEEKENLATIAEKVLKEITAQLEGAEVREQQITAVSKIASCLEKPTHLLFSGPTGSGKSLSYLIPAILSGKKVVVSTATKQLSEQLINKDIPFIKKALQNSSSPIKDFSAALLKGRDNYYCLHREAESDALDSKFDDGSSGEKTRSNPVAVEIKYLRTWADKTKTGDRSEAPELVSDKVWKQFSVNSTDCIGRGLCPFGDICFSEIAKENARNADIVVTNHAVVAHDLISESSSLGERSVFIFDEVHELDRYFSDAWGSELSPGLIKEAGKSLKTVESILNLPDNEFAISLSFDKASSVLKEALSVVEPGLIDAPYGELRKLLGEVRVNASTASNAIYKAGLEKNVGDDIKQMFSTVRKKIDSLIESVDSLMNDSKEVVKWIESADKEGLNKVIKTAPLRIGGKLQDKLEELDAIMIGASATIKVAGRFDIPKHNLGFDTVLNLEILDLTSPFDYKKQAMLYIPDDSFPAPVGADRKDHSEAVKALSREMITALNGRAMVLVTTSYEVRDVAEYLRKTTSNNIYAQGDMPNAQLIEKYRQDEHSVLVGTMGLWHGVDISGSTSSLIIISKIPFRPMNDPLFEARRNYADSIGRDGFMDVFVADANVMLTQGFGRLIRRRSDKGVIAILDTRLMSKKYGREMLASFPEIGVFRDKKKVINALERLASLYEEEKSPIADS